MAKKIRLCKVVFEVLHNSIKQEFERLAALKGGVPKGRGAEYYGFSKRSLGSNMLTLMGSMFKPIDKPDLEKYIEQNGYQNVSRKNLYNLSREFHALDPFDTVEVDPILLNIFCKYISHESFEDFLLKHPAIRPKYRNIQHQIMEITRGNLPEEELAFHYIGLYYSFSHGTRQSVRLWINYYNRYKNEYPAELTGLYNEKEEEFDETDHYTGTAKETPTCFLISLNEEKSKRPLTLMGYQGAVTAKDLKYIRCAATGISNLGFPFSLELFLIKVEKEDRTKTSEEVLSKIEGLSNIDYYLQAQRRNFRIPPRVIQDLNDIKARGVKAGRMQSVKGQYRIWSLGYSGDLIQSKFIINDNFTAKLTTIANRDLYRLQHCVFSISLIGEKLCVSSHPKFGVSVINYAIFDIDEDERNQIKTGVYCGIGVNGESPFVAESLIIFRDESSFEAKRVPVLKVEDFLADKPKFKTILLHNLLSQQQLARRHNFLKRINRLREKVIATN